MEQSKFKKGDVVFGAFGAVHIIDKDPYVDSYFNRWTISFGGGKNYTPQSNYELATELQVECAILSNDKLIEYYQERKKELELAIQFVKGNK